MRQKNFVRASALAFSACTLVLPSVALGSGTPTTKLFEIGTPGDGRNEFYDDVPPNGTLIGNCPVGAGTFVVGEDNSEDYPGFHRNANAGSTWYPYSCPGVTIQFEVGGDDGPLACNGFEITYNRFGAEVENVYLNDQLLGQNPGSATNAPSNVSFSPLGIKLPGPYEIRVEPTPSSDGWAAVDYWGVGCDAVVSYAKVSGRIDDPTNTRRGKGEPTHTFEGIVGVADSGVVGQLKVNYKKENFDWYGNSAEIGEACYFTPGPGATLDFSVADRARGDEWINSCDPSTPYNFVLYSEASNVCDDQSGRGCIGVSATPPADVTKYQIGVRGVSAANLDAGNVEIVVSE